MKIYGACFFIRELDKQKREVDEQHRQHTNSLQQLQKQQTQLQNEKFDLDGQVDQQVAILDAKSGDYQVLMKDYELAREREAELMGDRWDIQKGYSAWC